MNMIFIYANVDSVYDEMCRTKTPKNIRQIQDCWRNRTRSAKQD